MKGKQLIPALFAGLLGMAAPLASSATYDLNQSNGWVDYLLYGQVEVTKTVIGLSFDVTTGKALAAADAWTTKTDQNVSEFGVFSDGAKGKDFNRQSLFSFSATTSGATNHKFENGISAVPLPTAAWLFGSVLLGFISVSTRRSI